MSPNIAAPSAPRADPGADGAATPRRDHPASAA
jgi:hypothetical protein